MLPLISGKLVTLGKPHTTLGLCLLNGYAFLGELVVLGQLAIAGMIGIC